MSEGSFECKVERRSETNKGVFITLLVNPADLTPELQSVRVGAKLMIGWGEIVNTDVEPIEIRAASVSATNTHDDGLAAPNVAPELPREHSKKPRTPFHDLSPVQQAVLRCDNLQFRTFMDTANSEECARAVREHCGVASRADLSSNQNALMRWRQLSEEFERWALTQRYKDIIR